jgi:hypothetical protein
VKKFFFHFGGAVLVGLIISIGLFFLVPGWTRSDVISVFALIVAVWTAGSARWDTLRQAGPAFNPPKKQKPYQRDKRTGSVHFTLEKRSPSTFDLFARNIGKEDIREVAFKTTPFGNAPMPSFVPERSGPQPLLRPHEKVIISHGNYDRSTGISFEVEAVWKDLSGRIQKRKRSMTYH